MQYLSPEFALAFLAFLWLYWFAAVGSGSRLQNPMLLVASYGFYLSFDWRLPLLLAGFSITILGLAKLIPSPHGPRRWPLVCGAFAALTNLAAFKYYNFFREALASGFELSSLPVLDMLLPVGISFYTFVGLNYLFVVGRGERAPASWSHGLLFLSFFPTLLAGPICRPQELLAQIETGTPRKILHLDKALLLIVSALVKKIWLAGWLAEAWVNPVFADPSHYHALELIGAVTAYAWQLFFDFSGYTDVVTALALLLGFSLPVNFRQPYLALNLTEFWQRWHITLSRWIREFIYIPLGGNRGSWLRTQVNLVISMTLSGLWHGAGFTFIVWGLWHGLGFVAQNLWRRFAKIQLPNGLAQAITFAFVCCGWVVFRADNWQVAEEFFAGLSNWHQKPSLNWPLLAIYLCIFFAAAKQAEAVVPRLETLLASLRWWQKSVCCALIAIGVITLAPSGVPGFIYFGF